MVFQSNDPAFCTRGDGWFQSSTTLNLGSSEYPPLLAQCDDAPRALYCMGDIELLQRPAIAVVGTRNPSADGMSAAYALGRELAGAGFVVVSGLARGIDGAAHRGALDAGGYTVAVMATGLDRIYPKRHTDLARQIARHGVVLSEFNNGCEPRRWHFPRRNRTISGLSMASVVVEAGRPSGSLLTATAAAEQGRDVFAYPWSVYHRNGAGCRWLLAQGAQLACSAEDVVLTLGGSLEAALCLSQTHERRLVDTPSSGQQGLPNITVPNAKAATRTRVNKNSEGPITPHDPLAKTNLVKDELPDNIVALIGDGELDIYQLMQLTGETAECLLVQLTRLELDGGIIATSTGYRRSQSR